MSEKLNRYETVYIVRPTLDDEAVDRVVAAVDEFIKTNGGIVDATDKKGRRRLAYEVKKMRDGFYVQTNFRIKPAAVAGIKRMMAISEDIIREIVVVDEEQPVTV